MWDPNGSFAAQDPSRYATEELFLKQYNLMLQKVAQNAQENGLAAAIYTQLTDVEQEVIPNHFLQPQLMHAGVFKGWLNANSDLITDPAL